MTRVRRPREAAMAARLQTMVVLPTPPFWLNTTRLVMIYRFDWLRGESGAYLIISMRLRLNFNHFFLLKLMTHRSESKKGRLLAVPLFTANRMPIIWPSGAACTAIHHH